MAAGRPSSSAEAALPRTRRRTIATVLRWKKALTRKRPTEAPSTRSPLRGAARRSHSCVAGSIASTRSSVSSAVNASSSEEPQLAVDAHSRLSASLDVQVGSVDPRHQREHAVEVLLIHAGKAYALGGLHPGMPRQNCWIAIGQPGWKENCVSDVWLDRSSRRASDSSCRPATAPLRSPIVK